MLLSDIVRCYVLVHSVGARMSGDVGANTTVLYFLGQQLIRLAISKLRSTRFFFIGGSPSPLILSKYGRFGLKPTVCRWMRTWVGSLAEHSWRRTTRGHHLHGSGGQISQQLFAQYGPFITTRMKGSKQYRNILNRPPGLAKWGRILGWWEATYT